MKVVQAFALIGSAVCSVGVCSHVLAQQNYKGFYGGYCTAYAAQEFDKVAPAPKVDWRGNAGDWYRNADQKGWRTTPSPHLAQPGAVAVWSGGGFGHVAVVRNVKSDAVDIEEMNWGRITDAREGKTENFNKTSRTTLRFNGMNRGSYRFVGYVLPVRK